MKTIAILFVSLLSLVAARRTVPDFPTEPSPIFMSPYGPTKMGT